MGERERNRCRERLERLSGGSLEPDEARYAAIDELRRAVGFDRWCWPLTDPASGLSMSGIGEFDFAPSLPLMVALEEQGDVTSKPQLIQAAHASISLSAATRGDLARSRRWRECLHPYGIGDELMTACRDRHGCWGSVELMRDHHDRAFTEDEVRLLHDIAPLLGALLRRGLSRAWRVAPVHREPHGPGVLIVSDDLRPVGRTASLQDWLAELPALGGMLPAAAFELAARVLAPETDRHNLPPRVRIRTPSGRWAVLEGARLQDTDAGRVVITIRDATPDEVFDVLCKAHDLTARECQLAGVMRRGLATAELADALGVSRYTVQDHLKAIFEKTGLRSRRELMSHFAGA